MYWYLTAENSCFGQEPGKHICLFPKRPERLWVSLTVELFNAWWGKKIHRDEGAGEWSWQFTSTYCRVYNWVKLYCNSATRLQAGELLGWNLLGFGPSSFLGGYRRFGQLHSLWLQGWRFVKFYWRNEDKQTSSQTIKNKWGDFCKARVDVPCSV